MWFLFFETDLAQASFKLEALLSLVNVGIASIYYLTCPPFKPPQKTQYSF